MFSGAIAQTAWLLAISGFSKYKDASHENHIVSVEGNHNGPRPVIRWRIERMYCNFLSVLIGGGMVFKETCFISARWIENIPSAMAGFMSRSSLSPMYAMSPGEAPKCFRTLGNRPPVLTTPKKLVVARKSMYPSIPRPWTVLFSVRPVAGRNGPELRRIYLSDNRMMSSHQWKHSPSLPWELWSIRLSMQV